MTRQTHAWLSAALTILAGDRGYWIPTTSLDQYAATIGGWFGVSEPNLATIFPNLLRNFAPTRLGFIV